MSTSTLEPRTSTTAPEPSGSSSSTSSTPPPGPPTPRALPDRIKVGGISPELMAHVVLSLAGALSLTWLLYERLLSASGTIGFWAFGYATFLIVFGVVSATTLDRLGVVDRIVGALVATAGLVMVAALVGIVVFTFVRGRPALAHWNFYHQTMSRTGPGDPLDQGGILAAMVGTLEQVSISVVLSVPLGLATAVYLSEVRGRLARTVRIVVQAMTAVPTIVAGLFIYSVCILQLGWGRSGFAAALALSVSMIPVVITTAEVVLRLVPNGLREASLALGTSQWQTVRKVVLPTARPGLVTAVLLGVARIIGETSPVLIVAGVTSELNGDPLHDPQLSLPLFVFNSLKQPTNEAITRGFGAGVVLLALVVFFFALARIIGGRAPGHQSRRQQRRMARTFSGAAQ